MRTILIGGGIIALIVLGLWWWQGGLTRLFFEPTETDVEVVENENPDEITVFAENLDIPWELVFLPDGSALVTERPGTLLHITEGREAIPVEGVEHVGEGGLLGLALHPRFEENNYVYLYLTTRVEGGLINRVERYRFADGALSERTEILSDIPGAQFHDGGRIAFGPDNLLYITTGDAGNEDAAQDRQSLAGKILRLHDDGSIPEDNPFGNEVYSYGHRNPQGLAWDDSGRLWATEHGRSGGLSGFDEVNLIEAGENYGWPVIQGDETQEGVRAPAAHSGARDTWAPAGAVFADGSVFFAGLRGVSLYEAVLDGEAVSNIRAHLRGEYGRLRAIVAGPDDAFYILTSNTDGRGSPRTGDDKILRVPKGILE